MLKKKKFLRQVPDLVAPAAAASLDINQYQQPQKEKLRPLQFGGENWMFRKEAFVGQLVSAGHFTHFISLDTTVP